MPARNHHFVTATAYRTTMDSNFGRRLKCRSQINPAVLRGFSGARTGVLRHDWRVECQSASKKPQQPNHEREVDEQLRESVSHDIACAQPQYTK